MTPREQWLDITKGFAITLVVIGHVLIGFLTANMYPQLTNVLSYVVCTLYSFHMPLFFAISGYLYGRHEKRQTLQQYGGVAVKKLIRLGIPYVVFSLLQGLVRLTMNGNTNHPFKPVQLLSMFYAPFDQFWFLYTLLAIFLVVPLLEIATRKDGLIFLLLLTVKFLPAVFNIHIPLPFFEWLMAYALYFYAGTLMARHGQNLITNPKLLTIGMLIYIPFNLLFYSNNPLNWVLGNPATVSATAVSVGLAFSGILFSLFMIQQVLMPLRWAKSLLNILGLYSFEIYLLHTLPSAAIRIGLQKVFHTNDLSIHLTLAVALGIFLPIIVGQRAAQIKALDGMFYPGKYLKWPARQS